MTEVLRTARLTLRPVGAGDLAWLAAHWTAPDVRRFLFDGEAPDAAEIAEVIADGHSPLWVIVAGGMAIGVARLRPLEELGPEVYYSLAPEAWGLGYATEAARAVVEHALGPMGLPEVLAEVDEGNTASIAVVERLGMAPFEKVAGLLGPMIRYRVTVQT